MLQNECIPKFKHMIINAIKCFICCKKIASSKKITFRPSKLQMSKLICVHPLNGKPNSEDRFQSDTIQILQWDVYKVYNPPSCFPYYAEWKGKEPRKLSTSLE